MSDEHKVVPFERPAAYWVSKARKCRGRTRLTDAAPLLRQAYRQSGEDDVAMELVGTYCAMECHSAAHRVIAQVLEKNPRCAEAYYMLGLSALSQQQEALAEDALATALMLGRDSAFADDAQDILSSYAWHDEPHPPRGARAETLYAQALRYLNAGNTEKAAEYLRKSLCRGFTPRASALLGEIFLRVRGYAAASALLLRALAADRMNIPYALLLSEAFFGMNMQEMAQKVLSSAAPLCQTHKELALLAEVCVRLGRPQIASERLEQALRTAPQSNDLLFILAALRSATGDFMGAKSLLHTILMRDPEDADAISALKMIKFRPVPFNRIGLEEELAALCARKPVRGDAALKRLLHGLTISLNGDLSYATIETLVGYAWRRMNPIQKMHCDMSRQHLWPRAFYQYLCEKAGLKRRRPALYRGKGYGRRVRRMLRFIKSKEAWSEIR